MAGPRRLLVITHPVHVPIDGSDVEQALSAEDRAAGWDLLELAPMDAPIGEQVDWPAALDAQERLFTDRLAPEMAGRRLAYFGVAPVPLALHLGYRVTDLPSAKVYHRVRAGEAWAWKASAPASAGDEVKPLIVPERGSSDEGSVVIRVSASFRIDPSETREVVRDSLADLDVALVHPRDGAPDDVETITKVAQTFTLALSASTSLFPRLTCVHLFVAARGALAFRLGSEIKTNVCPPIVTYQYRRAGAPRYQAAIVLGGATPKPAATVVSSGGAPAHLVAAAAPQPLPEGPLPTFISYAPTDGAALARLEVHIKQLKRDGLLATWSAAEVGGGGEAKAAAAQRLAQARVVLLLVSPDFLASDDCYDVEMTTALARHDRHEATVIPILLRDADIASAPFAKLQFLPWFRLGEEKPRPVYGGADEPEAAFAEIAKAIRKEIERLRGAQRGARST